MPSLINELIEVIYKQRPGDLHAGDYADHFSLASEAIEFVASKIEALGAASDVVRIDAIHYLRKNAHLPIND